MCMIIVFFYTCVMVYASEMGQRKKEINERTIAPTKTLWRPRSCIFPLYFNPREKPTVHWSDRPMTRRSLTWPSTSDFLSQVAVCHAFVIPFSTSPSDSCWFFFDSIKIIVTWKLNLKKCTNKNSALFRFILRDIVCTCVHLSMYSKWCVARSQGTTYPLVNHIIISSVYDTSHITKKKNNKKPNQTKKTRLKACMNKKQVVEIHQCYFISTAKKLPKYGPIRAATEIRMWKKQFPKGRSN